ncbi:ABC transporter permease [Aureimonas fodinaquatilis]|uniref:ABC transporter permease n=1 Tax=Aureimonas fodinaquatilis TaxID=2565783 RepID=A0A5B0E005_9HYPH|nr:ABC transporter permease [Aureimonas fodinaquatilis]KAA0971958.1 ABC transporter permease [Aureimonas fodinaquatilis]
MIGAMFRVMALSVIRDRGALALAFLLPPVIFLIFAAIFSSASGGDIRLQVAFGASGQSAFADRLETALRAENALQVLPGVSSSRAAVTQSIESGHADAGLFIQGGPDAQDTAPLIVLVDPGKVLAGAILSGRLQRLIASELPDIALARTAVTVEALAGGFTTEQKARLDAALRAVADEGGSMEGVAPLVSIEEVEPAGRASATISYYAGAVSILFLLFSSLQGAATLIEERHAGILDRIAVGPAGTDVVVIGKFLFLTVQGIIQVALIFSAAALIHDLDVTSRFGAWFIVTLAASAAAAGLGLVVASACTSKQQAQTISTFVVLVSSALGGSMVPRFMMSPWLQDIGWFTPNAWAIESYYGILWRGDSLKELLPELSLLAVMAAATLCTSVVVSRKRLSL